MPGTTLLWDGPLNEGFWAELRSSLAWDNQLTIYQVSTNSNWGIWIAWHQKNMSRPYARYHISFIFLILLGQIRLSCDGGGFSRWPSHTDCEEEDCTKLTSSRPYAISLICSQDQVRCWLFLYDIMSATRGGTNRESLCQFGIGYVSWNQHRVGVTQCGLRHSSLLSVLCKGILQLAAIRLIWQEFSVVADQEDFMLIHKK